MTDAVALHRVALDEFGRRVDAIGYGDWVLATPCSDWDVRALVRHLVYEELWAPPLLEGQTVADVGDRFEGDILGAEPHSAWKEAAAAALAAADPADVVGRTVHLSFGDFSGADYLGQLTADHVIHAWDLAHAIGAEERLPADLVEFVHAFMAPQVDAWRSAGVFAEPVAVPPDTDLQSQLLALTGRTP